MTEPNANNDVEQDNEDQIGSRPTDAEPTASDMLVEAREAAGMSQKDVADQLFLTTTFIRYIDDGEFEKIPKPAFIKGYLRSYARVVNLPGEAVIEAYERGQKVTPQAPDLSRVTEDSVGSGSFTGPIVQTGVVGLIAIFVVAGLVWWFASEDEGSRSGTPVVTASPDRTARAIQSEQPVPRGEEAVSRAPGREAEKSAAQTPVVMPSEVREAMPQDEETAAAAADEMREQTGAAPEMQGENAVSTAPAEETTITEITGDVEIERVQDGDTQYITVYAGGEETLEFAFRDECWLEIEDGQGHKIYGDLNRAGDVLTVYGVAPFDVLFGRAPAATMIYEGEAVDLERFTTRDQTARVRTARL